MPAQNTMLQIRVDEETKALASEALAEVCHTVSEAVRLFFPAGGG